MTSLEGRDHDNMKSLTVYDTFALGEGNKEKLEILLYRLEELTKLKFSELIEEHNEAELIKLYTSLLELITTNQNIADPVLINEITYYYATLQSYDALRQQDGELYFRELNEIKGIVKRILSRFRLTGEHTPQQQHTETRKTRDTIRGRVLKHLADLLGRSRDK